MSRFNWSKKAVKDPLSDVNRALPYSDDMEKACLSCLLQSPQALSEAAEGLEAKVFYHPVNLVIYRELLAMHAMGVPVDLGTVNQWMADRGLLDKIGGPSFLAELLSVVTTPGAFTYYRGIIKDKYLLRLVISAGTSAIESAYSDQGDPEKVADDIEDQLAAVAQEIRNRKPQKPWGERVDDVANDWTDRYLGKVKSVIPSPWKCWNESLGGFRPGYGLILGLRKTGKSSLVGHKIKHLSVTPKSEDRLKSMVFTYETEVKTCILRLASNISGVRGECLLTPELNKPTPEERGRISKAMGEIAAAPIEFVNATGMNVYDIERAAKKFGADYIGIDYLMLLPWLPDCSQKEGTEGKLRTNSNAIINLSRNLGAMVDVINHSVATGDRAGESRWSDQPANDCDICIVVEDDGILLKENRNGKSGEVLPIFFRGRCYEFVEDED